MSNQHKKSFPTPISMKIGFYTVPVEILTHSEFQRSAMYGFRVRTRRKIGFSAIFSLPIVTKLTITLSEINFMNYNLHDLQCFEAKKLMPFPGESNKVHRCRKKSLYTAFVGFLSLMTQTYYVINVDNGSTSDVFIFKHHLLKHGFVQIASFINFSL